MSALSFAWSSSIDGALPIVLDANGLAAGEVTLSEGEHSLTLLLVDPSGDVVSDSRVVTIGPSNYPPNIDPVIFSPDPVYTSDVLAANVQSQDVEGDEISLSITWMVDGTVVHTEEFTDSQASLSLDGLSFFGRTLSPCLWHMDGQCCTPRGQALSCLGVACCVGGMAYHGAVDTPRRPA